MNSDLLSIIDLSQKAGPALIDSPAWICMLVSLSFTVVLRTLALWFNWQLPPWRQN
jgi:uncharacterized membrane protein YeiH